MKIQETISVISTQLQTQGEVAKQYIGVKSVHHEAYLHKQQESQVMKILHEVLPKDNTSKVNELKEKEKRGGKQKKQKFTVYTSEGKKKEIDGDEVPPEIDRTM